MIILEGVDNTGKSTLGKQIVDYMENLTGLENKLIHSPGPLDKGPEMVKWLFSEMMEYNPYQVYDRISLISDPIYSQVVRGSESYYISHKVSDGMFQILRSKPHLIIYCRPHMGTILHDSGRDQMEGVLENHEQLLARYDRAMEYYQRTLNVQFYDWEREGEFDRIISHVMETQIRMVMAKKNVFRNKQITDLKMEGN